MHSLFAELSPLVSNRTNLLSLGFAITGHEEWRTRLSWRRRADHIWNSYQWCQRVCSGSCPQRTSCLFTCLFCSESPPFPAPSLVKFEGFSWMGKMVFETVVPHLPRLLASWVKQSFLTHPPLSQVLTIWGKTAEPELRNQFSVP